MPQYLASRYEEKEQIKEALPTFKIFKTEVSKFQKLRFPPRPPTPPLQKKKLIDAKGERKD